ncbi:MAG: AAA family ATPase [Bacteroidales bacterium]
MENIENENQGETLELEVKNFAEELPYWAKYLAEKILSGDQISDNHIETSYNFLLEDLEIDDETDKPEIKISYKDGNSGSYKSDLLLTKLENIEGVNALVEKQTLKFSPNLTTIFGTNGSGKSGYVRLMKNVFYSKAPEEIIPNIHIQSGHKPVDAKFTFTSNKSNITLSFSDRNNAAFEQFAVFDGKSVLSHLAQKNEFEFRPAGLSFFADFTNAINKVEERLTLEIQTRHSDNEFSLWFEGESDIKTFVENLSAATKTEDLDKYTPFSEQDKSKKEQIQKKYDELLLVSKGKEKEIKKLENIKGLLEANKSAIENLNKYLSSEYLDRIKNAVNDCINKQSIAKKEGVENFKTNKIQGIGTEEWKRFIEAAEIFARNQKNEKDIYPETGDYCLLCHQPLSKDAENLIINYWKFIKSVAEENAKKAREALDQTVRIYEKLNFDLFPDDNTLAMWLSENYPKELATLQKKLAEQKTLTRNIILDIENKKWSDKNEIKIDTKEHNGIIANIEESIKILIDDEQDKELKKLLNEKIYFVHKEKFNTHLSKFQLYINNQAWIKKAGKADFAKRKITAKEKALSNKYFNQKYIKTFNDECKKLNGSFGIEVNHTGSSGKSYRQLKLKGRNPNAVLSEGEQKVIAIADFIAEMSLSQINRGLIFDDPVNSLDNERKKQIAERLAQEALKKQIVVFTHDLVFFYYIKNFSKKYLSGINKSFLHHSVERESLTECGRVLLDSSPANEGQFTNPTKAEEWLRKSKQASGSERTDNVKSGMSALRSSYEALAIFIILGGTVQRFDPQIRMGRLKDIKYDKALVEEVVEKFGDISDLIDAHLQSDQAGTFPTPDDLEEKIEEFNVLKEKIKNI